MTESLQPPLHLLGTIPFCLCVASRRFRLHRRYRSENTQDDPSIRDPQYEYWLYWKYLRTGGHYSAFIKNHSPRNACRIKQGYLSVEMYHTYPSARGVVSQRSTSTECLHMTHDRSFLTNDAQCPEEVHRNEIAEQSAYSRYLLIVSPWA